MYGLLYAIKAITADEIGEKNSAYYNNCLIKT